MSKKRLEKIKSVLLNGDVSEQKVAYNIEEMKRVLSEIDNEIQIQDRSKYNARYYIANKEKIDKKNLDWYHKNPEKARAIQKKYRIKMCDLTF